MILTPLALDTNTPEQGTPISEWLRQVDNAADGRIAHELRNLLAGLVSIRYEASFDGWTDSLLARDNACEVQLRLVIRGFGRQRLFFCDVTKRLVSSFATRETFPAPAQPQVMGA